MAVPDDYMALSPWEALITMINDYHSLYLTPESTQLVDIGSVNQDGGNTMVTVVVSRSTAPRNLLPPGDQYTFLYQRLSLSQYFKDTDLHFDDVAFPTDTVDVLKRLTQRTGVVFGDNDFEHQALDAYDDHRQVVLNAHPNSLRWTGSLVVTLEQAPQRLQDALTNRQLDTLTYPSGRDQYVTGSLYFMHRDFSDYGGDLRRVTVEGNTLPRERLLEILNAIDSDSSGTWTIHPTRRAFNCAGISRQGVLYVNVIYNGPVDAAYTPRRDIARVLVLELSTFYCNNVAGQLLIHYN